ncbi:putative transporter small subunit [uncultured Corynebacterium sp.]|nr:putative transporter small subunit [uncultured Corynebacterium sp.]
MVTAMTFYILVWPVLAALVLIQLTFGVIKDYRDARREGHKVV